jgi:hypothetical protein
MRDFTKAIIKTGGGGRFWVSDPAFVRGSGGRQRRELLLNPIFRDVISRTFLELLLVSATLYFIDETKKRVNRYLELY